MLLIMVGIVYTFMARGEYPSDKQDIANGKIHFIKYCSSCHGLEEDGFGPPLGGITDLLPREPLIKFIRNPSKVIASGDARAVSQLARYKLTMPSFDWMEENMIREILGYINHETNVFHLEAKPVTKALDGLTGRLVAPVKKSKIKIELEKVVQIPSIKGTSPDLGIVTLRPHPSGNKSFFVSDQNGIIYSVNNGKADVFLDIRKHIKDFQSGPGIATGIGSFDFHPDFLNNGLIYVTHAETFKGQLPDYRISDSIKAEVQWIIGEWKMDDIKDNVFRGKYRELLRLHAPTFAHGCQDIGFIPGIDKTDSEYGFLYVGYGDGGSNNIKRPELGHHLQSFLGTIMRIDPAGKNSTNGKYGIPPDNPFVNETDPRVVKEIYAFGFRNPHRMAWDTRNDNRMFVTDIGEANIEEINIVEKGGDYGWPNREGNFGITTTRDMKTVYRLEKSDLSRYKGPFAQYDHEEGNAIGGGYIYEGEIEALKNKYIFGDIVNGKLFYIDCDARIKDSTIYELTIVENGRPTTLQQMSKTKRLHQRIGYDRFNKILYVITKSDGIIRQLSRAY
jgi:hypothetical protein